MLNMVSKSAQNGTLYMGEIEMKSRQKTVHAVVICRITTHHALSFLSMRRKKARNSKATRAINLLLQILYIMYWMTRVGNSQNGREQTKNAIILANM